jgi:glucose/mannose transport system permease protein
MWNTTFDGTNYAQGAAIGILMLLSVAVLVIPYQSILIPLVKFMQFLKFYGDIPGLILVHIIYGIPITTLIFRNYYATVSTEILEAARMDGASLMGLYRHIILPLSPPSFAVVIIWQFTQAWNEFLFAIILTNQFHWPFTVALNNLSGSQLVQWNVLMARLCWPYCPHSWFTYFWAVSSCVG